MKRKYNLRKLNKHKSYSSTELQEVLGVHPQTIKTWKREGLIPIEGGTSPYYYDGDILIRFLSQRMNNQKVHLRDDELYCLKCKKAVVPKQVETVHRNILIGKSKESIFIKGVCPECKKEILRFSSLDKRKDIKVSVVGKTQQTRFNSEGWN